MITLSLCPQILLRTQSSFLTSFASSKVALKLLVIVTSCLMASAVQAKTWEYAGVQYGQKTQLWSMKCPSFTLMLVDRSIDTRFPQHALPKQGLMGHLGQPHLLSQEVIYARPKTEYQTGFKKRYSSIAAITPDYSRVDENRQYLAKKGACVGTDSVTVRLWGGGNCRDVCEAWALVTFAKDGQVLASKGLSYSEFKQYQLTSANEPDS